MNVTILMNALATGMSSAKRAANTATNPIIKQCHQQECDSLYTLIANLPKHEKDWQALLDKTMK